LEMLGEGLKPEPTWAVAAMPAGETLQEEERREAEMQAVAVVVMLVLAVSAQASAHWPAPGEFMPCTTCTLNHPLTRAKACLIVEG